MFRAFQSLGALVRQDSDLKIHGDAKCLENLLVLNEGLTDTSILAWLWDDKEKIAGWCQCIGMVLISVLVLLSSGHSRLALGMCVGNCWESYHFQR